MILGESTNTFWDGLYALNKYCVPFGSVVLWITCCGLVTVTAVPASTQSDQGVVFGCAVRV